MNTKERDITELLNQFNIQAEHIEPYVYKVINTSNEVDIDKFKWALNNCLLIISPRIRYNKNNESGISTEIAYVYYIITDIAKNKIAWKLQDKADKEFGSTIIDSYVKENNSDSIDTIYSLQELGKI